MVASPGGFRLLDRMDDLLVGLGPEPVAPGAQRGVPLRFPVRALAPKSSMRFMSVTASSWRPPAKKAATLPTASRRNLVESRLSSERAFGSSGLMRTMERRMVSARSSCRVRIASR